MHPVATCEYPLRPFAPAGDLQEVLADKLLFSAYMCLHHISELKKAAALSDHTTQVSASGRARRTVSVHAGAPRTRTRTAKRHLPSSGLASPALLQAPSAQSSLSPTPHPSAFPARRQIANARAVKGAMQRADDTVTGQLAGIKAEAQELLGQLEESYYSSRHKGRPTESGVSEQLRELCSLALESASHRK